MKKNLLLASIFVSLSAHAQTPKWFETMKFSGYGMIQYQANDQEESSHNEFNLRLLRMSLDGKLDDFDWKVQIQGSNAMGPGSPTVQLIDLYAEWVKHPELRVKVGQFKRAFTFENPTHPITQGWFAYAQAINSLSGFGDRTGEKSSGGRDIGLQLQGDILRNGNGRALLHYQIGIYNGEGINSRDKDSKKDVIGGLWVMPVKGLRIGAFGWKGSHGGMIDDTGASVSMPLKRYALSAEWISGDYTFRSEYIHSHGWGAQKVGSNVIDYAKGNKADGWYAFGIVPVVKQKLHAKVRYNVYRPQKSWSSAKSMYEIGFNYFFSKNVQLNVEYARVNDRSLSHPNYNLFDAQFDFRF